MKSSAFSTLRATKVLTTPVAAKLIVCELEMQVLAVLAFRIAEWTVSIVVGIVFDS